jgi:hypothetical protein
LDIGIHAFQMRQPLEWKPSRSGVLQIFHARHYNGSMTIFVRLLSPTAIRPDGSIR